MGSNALDDDYSNSENEFWIFGYGSLIWKPPPHFDRRVPGYVTGYVRRFWQVNSQPHDKTSPLTSLLPQSPSPNPAPNATHLTPLPLTPSEDHRGTPTSPGRVVTLIPHAHWLTLHDPHPIPSETTSPKVWGTAYRILASKVAEVREYLDIREINGYTIHYTPFYPPSSSSINPDNESGGATSIKTLVYIGTPDNAQFTGPQDPQELAEHIWRSEGPSGLNRDYLLSLDIALDELSPESGDEHVKDLANRVRKIAMGRIGVEAEASHTEVIEHELKKVKSTDEQEETEK